MIKLFSKVVSRDECSDSEDSEPDEPLPEPVEQKKDDEFEGLSLGHRNLILLDLINNCV